ncbi:MAG: carbohydrate ABC transporter permease [Anaerolineae bacterium]|nr:carbohydrate ABC transporter permease [Anaerolineae bacterium]MDW8100437.1 carbohydrate ABC transporter permease [Anaerolineae bacterium]
MDVVLQKEVKGARRRANAFASLRRRAYIVLWGTAHRMGLLKKVLVYSMLITLAAAFALPLYWMISTALKPLDQVYSIPPQWFPNPIMWSNFPNALKVRGAPVLLCAWNTIQYTASGVLGTTLSSALVAYAFARLDFPGKNALFMLILSTLMIPFAVVMVPQFIIWYRLGWLDTLKPLMIPPWFGGAFNIFLLRQFFLTLPKDYDEAALIDGASRWGIFWRIIVPLSKPALATVAVFAFVYYWNDFLAPLIIISSEENFVLTLYLANFKLPFIGQIGWNLYMAAATMFLVPCLLVFFFAQKLFVRGIVITGLKR